MLRFERGEAIRLFLKPGPLALAFVLAGCGASGVSSTAPKAHRSPTSGPATASSISTPYPTVGATATPATPRTSPTATTRVTPVTHKINGTAGQGKVAYASLQPRALAPSSTFHAEVGLRGYASRVELYVGSGSPTGPAPITYVMASAGGGRWVVNGRAPSAPGAYHFTVGVYAANGHRTIVDNDYWNVSVTGSGSNGSSVAQPLPADIPLAPPFSYGNPLPATFVADGKTVNGSEVVSTTRPDVSPSVVVAFYNAHLARAGWSAGEAPAGSKAFSLVGTKGNRVCLIEYGAYTVHIFYGATS